MSAATASSAGTLHAAGRPRLRVALIGTRGVPAQYGGFETAVEEVGRRLVARGHEVTVYCRRSGYDGLAEYHGMHLVHLPAVRAKSFETLSHTGASVAHLLGHVAPDAAVVFNAANAPFLPALARRGVPVATHVDGLEWQRAKWGGAGKRYYRAAEAMAVRWSDALIADADGIAAYYRAEFDAPSERISYGAPVLTDIPADRLADLGLSPGRYHLVVARLEPENHVHLALEGMARSRAAHPMVVVGGAPYASDYGRRLALAAGRDRRVRLLGPVYDQQVLNQLYGHALTYVHGHSVGGTNPSLLRAMGAGRAVLAYDVSFNREVLTGRAGFFAGAGDLAAQLEAAEDEPEAAYATGRLHRQRAERVYRWDDVADAYEQLCRRLASGVTQRGTLTGRRQPDRAAREEPVGAHSTS